MVVPEFDNGQRLVPRCVFYELGGYVYARLTYPGPDRQPRYLNYGRPRRFASVAEAWAWASGH